MPTNVLFIHGAGPQSGDEGSGPFVKHLRHGLGAAYRVSCPEMPAPNKPSYERWKQQLKRLFSTDSTPSILVGHSLGGSVLLKYISQEKEKIRAAGLFVVASPYWGGNDWEVQEFVLPEGFAQGLPETLKIYLYQSRDDEVVSMEHLSRYSKAIPQAAVRTLESGGHTFKSGLPELVADMRGLSDPLASERQDGA